MKIMNVIEDIYTWILEPLEDLPERFIYPIMLVLFFPVVPIFILILLVLLIPILPLSILTRAYIWIRFSNRRGK